MHIARALPQFLARFPEVQVDLIVGDDLQAGRLQAALTDYVPSERMLYALYLPNRHLSAKVRVFIDFLLERFAPPAYWDRDWMPADRAKLPAKDGGPRRRPARAASS